MRLNKKCGGHVRRAVGFGLFAPVLRAIASLLSLIDSCGYYSSFVYTKFFARSVFDRDAAETLCFFGQPGRQPITSIDMPAPTDEAVSLLHASRSS